MAYSTKRKRGRPKVGRLGNPIPALKESDLLRFWSKVDKRGPDECWEWTAQKLPSGYGRFKIRPVETGFYSHRVALAISGTPPAPDEYVDHICRNRACVNPRHLRPVDALTNSLENSLSVSYFHSLKTHCPQGHAYAGDNLIVAGGSRVCRACNREKCRVRYHARKLELEAL